MDLDQITTTALDSVQSTFKQVYLEAVDLVPESNVLSAQLERTRKLKPMGDGSFKFNVKLETGGKVANVPDAVLLPSPSRPKRKAGTTTLAHIYTTIAVGGQGIALTKATQGAFVSELQDNFEDGMTRVVNDVERQDWGAGDGVLAIVAAIADEPEFILEKPYGYANAGPGTMLMLEGMEVAFINPGDGTERCRSTVTEVEPDEEAITIDDTLDVADLVQIGDLVVRCNDVDATGDDKVNNYQAEVQGALAVTSSGNQFEGIDGAANPRWNGIDRHNSGTTRPVTERLIANTEAASTAKSGLKPTHRFTTRGIALALTEDLGGLRRYEGGSVQVKGGFDEDALEINGKLVLISDMMPKGMVFSLHLSKEVAGVADLGEMGYVDLDGAKLHRVEGRHAYRADLWFAKADIWLKRNCQARTRDLDDDNTIVR